MSVPKSPLAPLLVGLLCVGLSVSTASADQEQQTELLEHLSGIRASLDRIAASMESQVRHQGLELLMLRISLKERRVEPLERRLRAAEDELRERQQDLERLRTMLADQESQIDQAVRDGNAELEDETRQIYRELEAALRRETPVVDAAFTRVRELEDRIAEEREEILFLDELLAEKLE